MAEDILVQALNEIELDVARAILSEAKSSGFMEGDLPELEDDIIKESKYWFEEAYKAHEAGMQHDTVLAILNIASGGSGGGSEYNPGYAKVEGMVPNLGHSEAELRDVPVDNAVVAPVDPGLPADFVQRNNLPVPKDWQGDPEDMPRDISELTDRDVRRLSGEYNAYQSRAKWLLALAISDLAQSTHLRDHAYRQSLKKISKVDPSTDKAKLKEVLDAEARENPEFAKFDEAVLKHQKDVTILKSLVDIYSGNVDRLSREWTMRQDEYEKTR